MNKIEKLKKEFLFWLAKNKAKNIRIVNNSIYGEVESDRINVGFLIKERFLLPPKVDVIITSGDDLIDIHIVSPRQFIRFLNTGIF